MERGNDANTRTPEFQSDLCAVPTWTSTYIHVHVCCVALPCCLFDLACFFLSSFSHLTLKHVHVPVMYITRTLFLFQAPSTTD